METTFENMETIDGSQIYKMYRVKCKMPIHQGIYILNLKNNIASPPLSGLETGKISRTLWRS